MTRRGGDQVIPTPPGARPGDRLPWAHLPPDGRIVTLDRLRAGLASLRPLRVIDGPVPVADPRHSAVLAALYEEGDGLHVILTRRASHLRNHKGEVSFPGGRKEDHDADLAATALREAAEEIALPVHEVEILGELDRLSTYSSRSLIHPFVGLLPARPDALRADPNEVAAILHPPLGELLDDEVAREERWTFGDEHERRMTFFELVGDTVWGATARMLRQLLLAGLGLDPRT